MGRHSKAVSNRWPSCWAREKMSREKKLIKVRQRERKRLAKQIDKRAFFLDLCWKSDEMKAKSGLLFFVFNLNSNIKSLFTSQTKQNFLLSISSLRNHYFNLYFFSLNDLQLISKRPVVVTLNSELQKVGTFKLTSRRLTHTHTHTHTYTHTSFLLPNT